MTRKILRRAVAAGALGTAACHTFVLREATVAPEPAPVTRVDVAGSDTTYVLRTSGYTLLSRDRRLLWTHTTLDDAAHRYRALFGATPPAIAVRVDSAPVAAGDAWNGLPLVAVRVTPPDPKRVMPGEESAREVPQVAVRVAQTWVRSLGVPAGAWWLEVGATRLVADPAARVAAIAQAADAGDRTSLGALLGAPRPAVDEMVTTSPTRYDDVRARTASSGAYGAYGTDGSTQPRADRLPGYRGPALPSQAAALLLFLRDRDSAFVAELPARLRTGASLPELLVHSNALPHTVDAFDVEWRKWLKARAAGKAVRPPNASRAR